MPLSPSDKAFYQDKLSLKNLYYVIGVTMLVGGIGTPSLLFVQDWMYGLAGRWTTHIAFDWFLIGIMIGSMVAVLMYLGFKFLLSMEWLPQRR
jgi:hypothetical protein